MPPRKIHVGKKFTTVGNLVFNRYVLYFQGLLVWDVGWKLVKSGQQRQILCRWETWVRRQDVEETEAEGLLFVACHWMYVLHFTDRWVICCCKEHFVIVRPETFWLQFCSRLDCLTGPPSEPWSRSIWSLWRMRSTWSTSRTMVTTSTLQQPSTGCESTKKLSTCWDCLTHQTTSSHPKRGRNRGHHMTPSSNQQTIPYHFRQVKNLRITSYFQNMKQGYFSSPYTKLEVFNLIDSFKLLAVKWRK